MKKIYKIGLYLCMGVLCACTSSCKKYLDKKSDNSLVIPVTIDDLQKMLDDYYIMNENTAAMSESAVDDGFVLDATYLSAASFDRELYSWRLGFYKYPSDWSTEYHKVYNSNYCLEQVDKIEKTTQNQLVWNNVKGSASFFRAYTYLNLIWTFGKAYDEQESGQDMGIVLRKGSDFNVPSQRATVKECYDQIIQDLQVAVEYLPDLPLLIMTRPSKFAAYATLARTYLSMRKYPEALLYADKALAIKSELLDYNSPEIGSGNIPFPPMNKEIVFYTTQSTYYYFKSPSVSRTDTILYDSYSPDDRRKSVFFRPADGFQRFKGSYASHATTLFSGIAVDEVLITRAECLARTGKVEEAMGDLNALLEKRFVTGTYIPMEVSDQQEAIDLILLERRKELLKRGLRWMDIKRLNKENANISMERRIGADVFTITPNSNRYALPLPSDIIEITGIPQNEQ